MSASLRDLLPLVESGWQKLRAAVIGDVMLDQYVWGEVQRISPEAPVPVLHATYRDAKPGGAANVAMNLAGLGACVSVIGFAGGDGEQQILEALLADRGIEPLLQNLPGIPTTRKLRVLSGHQQMMRIDTEATAPISADDHWRLLESAVAEVSESDVVVLSDYAKGVLSEAICRSVIREAGRRGIPVLVDPKHRNFARYAGATAICPNLKELSAATGESTSNLDRLLSAGQALLPSLDVKYLIVTLGEKGIALLQADSRLHAPADVRKVYDVSGAGDTAIATLALALASGVPAATAIQLANMAAGIVVGKVGTAPIERDELLGALGERCTPRMDAKVFDLNRLLTQVVRWRSAGESIVFTNGCFDLLHIGHIRLLEEARRKGDRLIVALNSDNSVRRLKGPLRPVVCESERAAVLAALSAVDAVVMFHESTPLHLIEAIRPDVLVKGGDYTEDDVVGAREVRAWGGRVDLVPLINNISTTRLIAKSSASVLPNPQAKVYLA